MAKIIKNTTGSSIAIADTGITVPANSQYTIPPQDYWLWAASDNIITRVGNGSIVVNDGSFDLGISDGMDLIKGLFPAQVEVKSVPGEIVVVRDDDLNVTLASIASSLGATSGNGIVKYGMTPVTTKTETDLTDTIYTVPSGKKFSINNFTGSYDLQFTTIVRFKKQTGGTGAFNTMFAMTLQVGGQGQSTIPINFGNGVIVGSAGDVFKITYETTNSRGNIRAFFTGNEI
jgi:hypothetical protein